jgi:pyruvate/2-oxoglutarate/acetoin dehydrogenase E1 component
MGMFSDLMNKIFHYAATAERPADAAGFVRPGNTATAVAAPVDVAAILTKLASENKEKLDWKNSIVDLMKLVGMDSSLSARKTLAAELHYTGDTNDSASMNIWLHKEVMRKLADNGGKVPAELLTR